MTTATRSLAEMVVDTGSTMLVLPASLVRRLGLPTTRQIGASYSDGRREVLSVAGVVTLRWEDRETRVECVVGSDDIPPLLGQIPLEGLDVLVDCKRQCLVGRDPSGPVMRV